MIPSGVEIYVALEPVDMRLSFDRLAGLAHEQTGATTRGAALSSSSSEGDETRSRSCSSMAPGMAIFYKRLDRHTFKIPEPPSADARYVEVDDAALEALLDGVDIDSAVDARSRPKTH